MSKKKEILSFIVLLLILVALLIVWTLRPVSLEELMGNKAKKITNITSIALNVEDEEKPFAEFSADREDYMNYNKFITILIDTSYKPLRKSEIKEINEHEGGPTIDMIFTWGDADDECVSVHIIDDNRMVINNASTGKSKAYKFDQKQIFDMLYALTRGEEYVNEADSESVSEAVSEEPVSEEVSAEENVSESTIA